MSQLTWAILSIIAFIPAIAFHEAAHGWVAGKLGDPTAKSQGRVTLNPLKHIDIFGTVLLPAILAISGMPVFGYAKPVPYNPRYFKNIRKGEMMTGLAGPCANLILSLVGVALAWVAYLILYKGSVYSDTWAQVLVYLYYFGYLFTMVNLCLMFFNLIPVPPLDGSSVLSFFLPDKALPTYYKVQRYAFPIFFLIVIALPYLGIDPIGWYIDHTAVALASLMMPV